MSRIAPEMTFPEWLYEQANIERRDEIGDVARILSADPLLPKTNHLPSIVNYSQWKGYPSLLPSFFQPLKGAYNEWYNEHGKTP